MGRVQNQEQEVYRRRGRICYMFYGTWLRSRNTFISSLRSKARVQKLVNIIDSEQTW